MKASRFLKFSQKTAIVAGRPQTFMLAFALIVFWALSGPMFGFSDTWQLVVNTSTTIVTFLMVFLIQNTQNRDTEAMQIKLDELLRVNKNANHALLDLEELDEKTLDSFREKYEKLAVKARAHRNFTPAKIADINEDDCKGDGNKESKALGK